MATYVPSNCISGTLFNCAPLSSTSSVSTANSLYLPLAGGVMTGTLTANAGITASTLAVTGASSSASSSVTGALTAGSLTTAGVLSAGSGSISGALSTGFVSCTNTANLPTIYSNSVQVTGPISATSLTTSGTVALSSGSVTTTGAISAGSVTATGAISAGSMTTSGGITGTLQTASQPQITSVGSLSSLTVTGSSTLSTVTASSGSLTGSFSTGTTNYSTSAYTTSTSPVTYVASNGACITTAQAKYGSSSLSGNTSNGYVQMTNVPCSTLTTWTVEMWVYFATPNYLATIFSFTASNVNQISVSCATTGKPTVYLAQGLGTSAILNSYTTSGAYVFTTAGWSHLMVSYDGSNIYWGLNGTIFLTTAVGSSNLALRNFGTMYLCAQAGANPMKTGDCIDELRISCTCRYSGNIGATYTQPSLPYTSDISTVLTNSFSGSNGSTTLNTAEFYYTKAISSSGTVSIPAFAGSGQRYLAVSDNGTVSVV